MTIAQYRAFAQDNTGNVLASASVEVRNESGGALASLFSDRAGSSGMSNPFNADSDGYFEFHVAGGAYKIVVTSGAITRTFRYVGIGTFQEYDIASVPSLSFTGATLDWGGGDVTLSYSANLLTLTGGDLTVPILNATTVNATTVSAPTFSLPSGGVIGWNSSDVVITHSTDTLTVTGGGVVLAAGTTGKAALQIPSGSKLTTPVAGGFEYDGASLFFDPAASSRGVVCVDYLIRQHAAYTLTSSTNVQQLFNGSAGGAVTLPTGAYLFESLIGIDTMSATSGNAALQLAVGTATITNILQAVVGIDGAAAQTGAAIGGSWSITADMPAANTSAVTAAVNTAMFVLWKGSFEVTGAGTVIPSIDLITANAAVVKIGSYFRCWRVGDATDVVVGNWS